MKVTVSPCNLKGKISAIPSKSAAHRALICSALADGKTELLNLPNSKDIEATVNCLKALKEKNTPLNCGESGSTLRFLLPVALTIGGNFTFKMHGRLPDRPLYPLDRELTNHGGKIEKDGDMLHVSGKLSGGIFNLPGNVSSQFITGLLFSLPLLKEDSEIHIDGILESLPYIELTQSIQHKFGVVSEFKNNVYYVKGNQKYINPPSYTTEGDWSNGAFWLCADALSEEKVEVFGLDTSSKQGDKEILNILENLPCTIDARNIPDLIPIVSAVASVTKGTTKIVHAERLIIKESDRLDAIYKVLSALDAEIKKTEDGLIINGKEFLSGGTIDSFNDHRIAMTAAILAIKCKNEVIIERAEAVNKSYPDFWSDYQKLGGIIKEEI